MQIATLPEKKSIDDEMLIALNGLRANFKSGAIRSYDSRRNSLLKLKALLLKYEEELYDALYADLRKSKEEAWVTELGFVLSEINHTLANLKKWMRPKRVSTNLMNLPSSSHIYKEPLGVVLIIGPWNYPFQLLFGPLVGALAAGNAIVLKPSEHAPATTAVMKKLIAVGFSKNEILYIEGDGSVVIPSMMNNFRFDHVFFTGGTAVGKAIYKMAAAQLVPVTLELGGKSPCVVEADANIEVAARRIGLTTYSNAGQMCIAPDYILVHHSVKNRLVELLQKVITDFFTEDPAVSYNYGRIINEKQFQRISSYLKQGRVIFGGKTNAADLYIEPTLMDEVSLDAPIMQEEIFGPVLPIISFNTMDEAIEIISRNPNPLSFYVYTSSKEKEEKWIHALPFGGGAVNNSSWHFTNPALPFGGRGTSGMGACHGKHSFDCFTHEKAVLKTPTWFDPAMKYPPFKGKLSLFRKLIR